MGPGIDPRTVCPGLSIKMALAWGLVYKYTSRTIYYLYIQVGIISITMNTYYSMVSLCNPRLSPENLELDSHDVDIIYHGLLTAYAPIEPAGQPESCEPQVKFCDLEKIFQCPRCCQVLAFHCGRTRVLRRRVGDHHKQSEIWGRGTGPVF